MSVQNILIEEFVDKKTLSALDNLLAAADESAIVKNAVLLADFFGLGEEFKKIADNKSDEEEKLISSFTKNLVLLIQKTWVEKSDEAMKAQVLYNLEELRTQLGEKHYGEAYGQFFSITEDVVYLMFGNQSKSKDFLDYALRIDPEFGIFWFYLTSLPKSADWTENKYRTALLLAMYFIANY